MHSIKSGLNGRLWPLLKAFYYLAGNLKKNVGTPHKIPLLHAMNI